MQMGAIAAPITYEVNGEQYIAFMVGWAGAPGLYVTVPCADGKRASTGRILAYKLGGDAKLPPALFSRATAVSDTQPARLTAESCLTSPDQARRPSPPGMAS